MLVYQPYQQTAILHGRANQNQSWRNSDSKGSGLKDSKVWWRCKLLYPFEWRKSKGNVILPVILKFCGPSIFQKEISKQKQKYCSYLFVQIRWEEARDYVNVIKIHSLPEPAAGPKILEFSCTQKESVFCVFVAVMSLVKILVFYRCHFYYFFYTWKINIQRAEERWRGSGKPALAFENVDFVDDVVIFVIVRINETRKVLYVKVLPRYYINK